MTASHWREYVAEAAALGPPRSASVWRGRRSVCPMPIDITDTFTQCAYVYSSWFLSAPSPTIE